LHTQLGAAPSGDLPQSATCGAWHVTSQRRPLTTEWHMLPVLPAIEPVLTPVSAFTELDTLEELDMLDELLDSIDCLTVTGLSVSSTTLWAETMVHSAKPVTVARYFMSGPPMGSSCRTAKH
jgi:hypothetical protein